MNVTFESCKHTTKTNKSSVTRVIKITWRAINNILDRAADVKNMSVEVKPYYPEIRNEFNDLFLKVDPHNDVMVGEEFMKYLHNSPYSLNLPPATQTEIENNLETLKTTSGGYDEILPVKKHMHGQPNSHAIGANNQSHVEERNFS